MSGSIFNLIASDGNPDRILISNIGIKKRFIGNIYDQIDLSKEFKLLSKYNKKHISVDSIKDTIIDKLYNSQGTNREAQIIREVNIYYTY